VCDARARVCVCDCAVAHAGKWCLPAFAQLLSLDNALTLLCAIMLERRHAVCACMHTSDLHVRSSVIFVSENAGRLSVCVLACIPLLRPWVWQGTCVTDVVLRACVWCCSAREGVLCEESVFACVCVRARLDVSTYCVAGTCRCCRRTWSSACSRPVMSSCLCDM
jgi:hypothetical protein